MRKIRIKVYDDFHSPICDEKLDFNEDKLENAFKKIRKKLF